jgi:DNA-directed RNA polymerase subunit RPC12/RpoP
LNETLPISIKGKKGMKWYECGSCLSEFRVVSDIDDPIAYCPFCGSEIEDTQDDDEEGYDYND